jgi:hypothetical protein
MWSKLLYFALAFESTSALVRMVLEILVDMKHFLLLLVTVMIGFGCAFFVVFRYCASTNHHPKTAFDLRCCLPAITHASKQYCTLRNMQI